MKAKKVVPGWVFYVESERKHDPQKVGKWMFFFNRNEVEKVDEICKNAIERDIVASCKYTDVNTLTFKNDGVCCFYLHYDDEDSHKKVITYFLENNLISKTKTGKLYNISFKKDAQTRAGEYGDDFSSEIKLEQFISLYTGEWIK